MSRKKLAMIFPYAPSYRDAIYRLMDEVWDIDWFFAGNCDPHLKLFDYSVLKNVDLSLKEKKFGPLSSLNGVGSIDLSKYEAVVIPGVFRCVSDLLMMYRHRGRKGPRLYLWTHGWYGKETHLEKAIKKFFYPRVDGIFLYGQRAKKLMTAEGFDPGKLHVIYNSLDYDRQLSLRNDVKETDVYTSHFKNSGKNLIFLGRLTPEKKLKLLLEAVSQLKTRGENYNLVFVGDGDERGNLERIVKEKYMEKQVWFYGQCFDEAKNAEFLYNADLCVSPGNVGLTAIHSLMFGCPVVSNDDFKTQMPEFEVIVSGKTGAFFHAYDASDLAQCISGWFKSAGTAREQIREACFKTIDESWNPEYQLEVLKNVIGY